MKKAFLKFGLIILTCTLLSFVNSNYGVSKSLAAKGYYTASCTKNFYEKFHFTKGDRKSQQDARKRADKAARKHKEEYGHDSGVMGPY